MPARIIVIDHNPVHVSVEEQFWECLEDIARRSGKSLSALAGDIAREMGGELSSALRVYVLSYYQFQAWQAVMGPQSLH